MLEKMDTLYQSFKQKELHLIPLACSDIIEQALQKFFKKYPLGKVKVSGSTSLMVLGDGPYLSEAFYNILTNGWEAELEKNPEQQATMLFTIKEERLQVSFILQDFGTGIPKANRKKVFEPFFSSKNSMSNWGMGMHFVKNIVENHMGSIRFESSNLGTTVFIVLPKYRRNSL
jgi:signal transduction histidine kinase